MDLSVVFATFQNEDVLEKSLKAYCEIKTVYKWELIIVDNGDSQKTREIINLYKNNLPLVFIEKSEPGKNNAINKALQSVQSEIIWFTDNDIIPSVNHIDTCIDAALKYPKASVFSGKILPDRKLPVWIDMSSHRVRSALGIYDKGEEEIGIFLEDVWGGNMLVRASVFDKGITFNPNVGPNGSNYVMGSETELLKRLEKEGHSAVYIPTNQVRHQIRESQLDINWLTNRAYRSGRGNYLPDESLKLFGIPRYLIRLTTTNYLKYITACLSFDKRKILLAKMEYFFSRGKLSESFKYK